MSAPKLPADPELLAAHPPNPARDARPGRPFRSADGCLWVLLAWSPDAEEPWFQVAPDGKSRYARRVEAEDAGLVPLDPPGDPFLRKASTLTRPHLTIADLKFEPAPLDLGDSGQLRRCAADARAIYKAGVSPAALAVERHLLDRAERLDRERAEAEQDASDRKRAEEAWTAANNWPKWGDLDASVQVTFTSGYRAGRAAVDEQPEGDKKILIREADALLAAMSPDTFGERAVRRLRDAHAKAVDDSIRRAIEGKQ
ncbi:hypothetical protein ACXYTP_07375 [Tsukamurella ocularis]|uniref:hypothetical protein n=1 Tax=Tsukamurella ocularis TaxID=1970234 RepID=UPI0039EEE034